MSAEQKSGAPSRREFIKTSSIVGGAAAAVAIMSKAYAGGGDDVLKVGWIGCGSRGSGAIREALLADTKVKLVAVGDAFKDRIESSLATLSKVEKLNGKVDVAPEKQFVGFDAYKKVVDSGVDVVVLTTPPHFRPIHLKYAIDNGKHAFCEKPVAVDGPGVRSVMASCAAAKEKKLSIVSGLCWRYDAGTAEFMKVLHSGAIGDIRAVQSCYLTGELWKHPRKEGWSDMEYQMRNWLYYSWLSGDMITEQHIHSLDKVAWAMKGEYPVSAISVGGRQVRTDAIFGNAFDHFSTIYEYANGAKCFSYCRQQNGTEKAVKEHYFGTKGTGYWDSPTSKIVVDGKEQTFDSSLRHAYQEEHNVLFAAIRKGEPVNNGEYMCKSTLMAIMGRMSAYTGQIVTWDQALNSTVDLSPKAYEFGKLDFPAVAIPGVTKIG